MTISLGKGQGLPVPPAPGPSPAVPAAQLVRDLIARRFSVNDRSDYCAVDTWNQLARAGIDAGLDPVSTRTVIDIELERASIVNEKLLLEELEDLLRRLCGRDKKLKEKDQQDALQLVCRPRPGCSRGLEPQTATRFVLDFCRTNQIAVKVGLFQWRIP